MRKIDTRMGEMGPTQACFFEFKCHCINVRAGVGITDLGKNSEIEIQIKSVLKLLLTSGRISKSEFLTSYTPYYLSTFSLL